MDPNSSNAYQNTEACRIVYKKHQKQLGKTKRLRYEFSQI